MVQLKEFSSLYWRIEISRWARSIPSATAFPSMAHSASRSFLESSRDRITSCQSMVLMAFTYSRETSLLGIPTV